MFTGATCIIDNKGRPVFVVPVDLPVAETGVKLRIQVTDEALEFYAGNNHIGHIEEVDASILVLSAMQKKIGLIAWSLEAEKNRIPCPDHLTHIAMVEGMIAGVPR